jgi:5-methylcytosine-specific restriction endonuclease McrA
VSLDGTASQRARRKAALVARDGATCWYCGHQFEPDLSDATVDHLIPRSELLTWRLAALVLACEPCNAAKADTLPSLLLRPAPGTYGPGLAPGTRPSPVPLAG